MHRGRYIKHNAKLYHGSSPCPLRIQLDTMLSTCGVPRMIRVCCGPPGRVGGREGFCSRAIPGPCPSQNPALCGAPPTKCSPYVLRWLMEGCHSLGVLSVVQQPAASSTSFQTKKMVLRSRAPSRSSSLSSTLVRVAAATSVSSQKAVTFPLLSVTPLTTAFRQLTSFALAPR